MLILSAPEESIAAVGTSFRYYLGSFVSKAAHLAALAAAVLALAAALATFAALAALGCRRLELGHLG